MSEPEPPASPAPKPRVLVVEDEMLLAMLVQDTLTELGYEVVGPVSHVAAALQLVGDLPLDGAVLDINLGDERVYPVAEELSARGIPFLFATGYDVSGIEEAFRARPRLQKPFRDDELERMVRKVILSS